MLLELSRTEDRYCSSHSKLGHHIFLKCIQRNRLSFSANISVTVGFSDIKSERRQCRLLQKVVIVVCAVCHPFRLHLHVQQRKCKYYRCSSPQSPSNLLPSSRWRFNSAIFAFISFCKRFIITERISYKQFWKFHTCIHLLSSCILLFWLKYNNVLYCLKTRVKRQCCPLNIGA